jgi:hypothetical protein
MKPTTVRLCLQAKLSFCLKSQLSECKQLPSSALSNPGLPILAQAYALKKLEYWLF